MFCDEHGTADYCPECIDSAKDETIAQHVERIEELRAEIVRWQDRYQELFTTVQHKAQQEKKS